VASSDPSGLPVKADGSSNVRRSALEGLSGHFIDTPPKDPCGDRSGATS